MPACVTLSPEQSELAKKSAVGFGLPVPCWFNSTLSISLGTLWQVPPQPKSENEPRVAPVQPGASKIVAVWDPDRALMRSSLFGVTEPKLEGLGAIIFKLEQNKGRNNQRRTSTGQSREDAKDSNSGLRERLHGDGLGVVAWIAFDEESRRCGDEDCKESCIVRVLSLIYTFSPHPLIVQ